MKDGLDLFKKFFGVGFQLQTYLNLIYLALALPLGVIYFVFLVTGLALGLSTSIILVGIIILAATLAVAWALVAFERQLAIWLVGAKIGPMSHPAEAPGFWSWLKAYLGNPVTWTGLLYLCLKFPIGLIVFCVMVALLSLSAALLLAPFTFGWLPLVIFFWPVDSLPAALTLFAVGLLVAPLSLHILNFLAYSLGQLAHLMLGRPAPEPRPAPAGASRPATSSCLLPFAALALFACAAFMLCSATAWSLLFGQGAQREHAPAPVRTAASQTATLLPVVATPAAATEAMTATPAPTGTSTAIPASTATRAASPTATEAATYTPTPTATSAATATLPPSPSSTFTATAAGPDPMAEAGNVLFEETFGPAKYYWGTGDGKFSNIQIKDGALNVTVKEARHIAWTFSGAPAKPDFYFSGAASAATCADGDYFGLVFRARDDAHLVLFGVSCDGRYQVVQNIDGTLRQLAAPAASPAILTGLGAVNQLGVRAVGKQLNLYANGQFLASVEVDYTLKGVFGAYASAAQTPNLTVTFDNLKAWEIKP